jgi:hypothetical protein
MEALIHEQVFSRRLKNLMPIQRDSTEPVIKKLQAEGGFQVSPCQIPVKIHHEISLPCYHFNAVFILYVCIELFLPEINQ